MGFLDNIRSKRPKDEAAAAPKNVTETITNPEETRALGLAKDFFRMFIGYAPVFTSAPEGLYEMELVRSAIHSFASFCSKLKPEVRGAALQHLERQWEIRINPYMDTSKFLYRVATILSVNNNAFIIPLENEAGAFIGYWPLLPQNCEIVDKDGVMYLRYYFSNGQKAAIEFDRVGIVTQHQYLDDFFGESNHAIKPTMQMIHTNNEGIVNNVKNSAIIRYIGKLNNMFDDEDIQKERDRFSAENLSNDNQSGIILYDNKYASLEQVKYSPVTINAAQMKQIAENVFTYFGTNENILQNKYDEEGFNAFYEGKIAPFANQLSLVLSSMAFSNRELAHDNRILFTTNRLQYASAKTKLTLSTTGFDRGLLTRNEIREMWGKPNVAADIDGNTFFIRSEYTRIEDLGKDSDNNAEVTREGIQDNDTTPSGASGAQ